MKRTDHLARVTPSRWLSYMEIEPPLATYEQFVDAYVAAYQLAVDDDRPTEADFQQSRIGGVTEFRFRDTSTEALDETAKRICNALAEKHQLQIAVGNIAVQ